MVQDERFQKHRLRDSWLIVLAMVFVASTLRAPLTAVGPVIDQIKDALSINNSVAGILTTIPLLIFGIVSPFVSKVSSRLTMSKTVFLSTILVIIALIVRVSGGFPIFILGTVLLGIGIAFGNVVLPSYVKWKFPLQIGLMTGLYSGTMNFT
ncbi:MAG: MFS transporter, partial [Staphylococcus simulans]|nr:MFS transporter [Staphylococcus simulans]